MHRALSIAGLFFLVATSHAQELEEVVVTGTFASSTVPGIHLRRTADYLLLSVQIVNDSRDADQREDEIHKTLLAALSSASKNKGIELSTITDSGFVTPLTKANYQIELSNGSRPDTSEAYFRAKTAVPSNAEEGEALVLELKRFISGLDMVGRTLAYTDGDVELSIVNPNQYRSEAIKMFAEDVRMVTSALGEDYRVIVNGIDQPVEWVRAGSLSLAIYIPYNYTVVPTSINSVSYFPDY